MAKRLSILFFLCCIGAASDDIPVTVKEGPKTIGTAKSLRWLELHGSPGVLEARLEYAVIGKQEITLKIRLKDYNTKRP